MNTFKFPTTDAFSIKPIYDSVVTQNHNPYWIATFVLNRHCCPLQTKFHNRVWSTATHVGCRYFHKTAMGILPCRPKLRIVKFLSSSRNLLNQRFQKNVCMFVWTWENELKRFIISYHIGYYAEMKDFNFHGQNFWVTCAVNIPDSLVWDYEMYMIYNKREPFE